MPRRRPVWNLTLPKNAAYTACLHCMHNPCRWAALLAALIAYGSLYPFKFAVLPERGGLWSALLTDARVWTGLGDVAGNVALFVPLGVLGVLCIGAHRVGAATGFALT